MQNAVSALSRLFSLSVSSLPLGGDESLLPTVHSASASGIAVQTSCQALLRTLGDTKPAVLADACVLAASACEDTVLLRVCHVTVLCQVSEDPADTQAAGAVTLALLAALKRCQRYIALRTISLIITPLQFTQLALSPRTVGITVLRNLLLGYQLGPQLWHNSVPACAALLHRPHSDIHTTLSPSSIDVLKSNLFDLRLIMFTCVEMFSGYSYLRDAAQSLLDASLRQLPTAKPSKAAMDSLIHIFKWSENKISLKPLDIRFSDIHRPSC